MSEPEPEARDDWLTLLREGRSGEPHVQTPDDVMAMLAMPGTPMYLPDGTLVGMSFPANIIE